VHLAGGDGRNGGKSVKRSSVSGGTELNGKPRQEGGHNPATMERDKKHAISIVSIRKKTNEDNKTWTGSKGVMSVTWQGKNGPRLQLASGGRNAQKDGNSCHPISKRTKTTAAKHGL